MESATVAASRPTASQDHSANPPESVTPCEGGPSAGAMRRASRGVDSPHRQKNLDRGEVRSADPFCRVLGAAQERLHWKGPVVGQRAHFDLEPRDQVLLRSGKGWLQPASFMAHNPGTTCVRRPEAATSSEPALSSSQPIASDR